MIYFKFTLLFSFTFLAACSSYPRVKTYSGPDSEYVAYINASEAYYAKICNEGVGEPLKSKNNYATIPALEMVRLNHFYSTGSSYCSSSLIFIPEPDKKYYLNHDIREERCFLEVYEEGVDNEVGLGLVRFKTPENSRGCEI